MVDSSDDSPCTVVALLSFTSIALGRFSPWTGHCRQGVSRLDARTLLPEAIVASGGLGCGSSGCPHGYPCVARGPWSDHPLFSRRGSGRDGVARFLCQLLGPGSSLTVLRVRREFWGCPLGLPRASSRCVCGCPGCGLVSGSHGTGDRRVA